MSVHTVTSAGRSYRIAADDGGRIHAKVSRGEPYERRLLTDVRQRHHSGTAVDVGAHIGNHTLYLAAVCELRVLAFEPRPATFAALESNLALNPHLDIEAHMVALGASSGSGALGPRMTVEPGPGDVEVAAFDDRFRLDDLAVVKVDVEGMEAEVLAGMVGHLERCGPTVYVEAHTDDDEAAHRAVLEPLGYALTRRLHMGSTMHRWEAR